MKQMPVYFMIVVLVLIFAAGCDDNCIVCPGPPEHVPDYHLLFSYIGDGLENYVLTFSTKSGDVIDSMRFDGDPFDNMIFSHDGRYACYTSNYNLRVGSSETWVTNWPEGDTVAHVYGTGALGIFLTPDDKYLLLTGGNLVAVLNFPDLTPIYRDSVKFLRSDPDWQGTSSNSGAFHPSKPWAYVSIQPYFDSIFVLDYSQTPVSITSHQLIDELGNPRDARGPLLCTDKYLVVIVPSDDTPTYLGIFDPTTLDIIRDRLLPSWISYGGPLHPDGHRLFLAYNGGSVRPTGGIDIYDLETDVLRQYVTVGEIDLGAEAFVPSDIQFTPDGETMYVMMGATGFWLGPILELDIQTKEVTRRWNFTNGFSRLIRLNSKDQSK